MRPKNPKYDLKNKYARALELSLIITLALISAIFISSKKIDLPFTEFKPETIQITFTVVDIPKTFQDYSQRLRFEEKVIEEPWIQYPWEEPPLPPQEEVFDFFAVEIKPELIGGAQAIYDYITNNDLYPEMARIEGMNGDVIIRFIVGADGNPSNIEVFQEKPADLGFGEAGVKAMKNMKFKPGRQRDRYVAVNMQQVIRFRLE